MRALLVDTNFSAYPIYHSLTSQDFEVFVVGNNPKDFLALSCENYIQADYSNVDNLQQIAEAYQIDVLVPGCNDLSYASCSQLNAFDYAQHLDSFHTIQTLTDKSQFRAFALNHQLNTPKTYNIESALQALSDGQTLIVKPTDSFSGMGVSIVKTTNQGELQQAINQAKFHSAKQAVVIEDFIEGQLYSHSAFLKQGQIETEFFVEEYCTSNPFAVDTSFVIQSLPKEHHQCLKTDIEKIAGLLDLKDGLIHTQFIVANNQIFIIEITRRCPGDLYSDLIQLSTEFDYSTAYISSFLGKGLPKYFFDDKKTKNGSTLFRHTVTQNSTGRFLQLTFHQNLEICRYISLCAFSEYLEPSPKGRVGILFNRVDSEQDKQKLLQQFINQKVYSIELQWP